MNEQPKAWNKNEKRMELVNSILYVNPAPDEGGYVEVGENWDIWYFPDIVLLKPTGLSDKNGKLIYEGEILKDNKGIGVVKYHQSIAAFIVDTLNGEYFWLNEGNPQRLLQLEYTEVIGNIYENPDLLT